MSQSNLFVDIGHSAVKWRTLESEVFSKSVDKFSEKSLPDNQSVWLSAVAHPQIVEVINTKFSNVEVVKPLSHFGSLIIALAKLILFFSPDDNSPVTRLSKFSNLNMLAK